MNDILKWQISVLLSMQAKKHFLSFAVNDIWELLISIHVIVYKQCDFHIQSLHPCTAMWLQLLRINSSSVHTYICVCFIQNYRSGTVNLNTVNSKFHLIQSYCEIFVYNCPNIWCLKYTVNSNFHLIRSKTLPTNDFELTVPDLYPIFNTKLLPSLAQSKNGGKSHSFIEKTLTFWEGLFLRSAQTATDAVTYIS